MIITVIAHAIGVILLCGLAIWLVGYLPIDARFRTIARVVIVVVGLIEIARSLDLLALRCC